MKDEKLTIVNSDPLLEKKTIDPTKPRLEIWMKRSAKGNGFMIGFWDTGLQKWLNYWIKNEKINEFMTNPAQKTVPFNKLPDMPKPE